MEELIECVANFSEGKDQKVIDSIASAINRVKGGKLLHWDSGMAANRTVFTFAGSSEAVISAAFEGAKVAAQLIDMRKHQGEHPRIGALDVCPFIPISGISKSELLPKVDEFAKRLWIELGIPVFLYEDSASSEERKALADHRKGNYEALEERLKSGKWKADYGIDFNAKSGGTVCGVRDFLVAYNINLSTKDVMIAKKIAYSIRQSGWPASIGTDEERNDAKRLTAVKAIGWYIGDFDRVQISINLSDYHKTPLWKVFMSCVELAEAFGTSVSGSELIGLIPLEAALDCGKYFLGHADATENELIQSFIKGLGLDELSPFNPQERILEYRMANE